MLALSKLYPTLSYAENEGLFDELNEVYQRLPETTCDRCATCCTVPPPGYLIEFLNLFRYVRDNLKTSQREIMENTLRYFFLELVDINVKCPFLDGSNNCKVYPVRPLSCRMFGLLSEKDSNLGARRQLGAVAENTGRSMISNCPAKLWIFSFSTVIKCGFPMEGKRKFLLI